MFPYACVLILGLGVFAGSLPAEASNFEIAPVVLELSMNRSAGVIRIVNKDNHPVSLQVRGYEWTQLDNDDQLNNTESLLISPPMFVVEPGAAQVVRVVSRKPLSSNVELAFRLLIDEIPDVEQAAVTFKFRISMPVFMQPEKMQAPKINWRVEASGKQAVVVENLGGQRTKLLNINLGLPDGKRLTPKAAANPYALAGATRRYEFESSAGLKPGQSVKIYATSDSGPVEVETTVLP